MKLPRSIADRLLGLRALGKRKHDVFLDETITLPLQAARRGLLPSDSGAQ